jgi:hypothetical protein
MGENIKADECLTLPIHLQNNKKGAHNMTSRRHVLRFYQQAENPSKVKLVALMFH